MLYYWTTISNLSTCHLKTSVMPTGYPDLIRRTPKYSRIQSSQHYLNVAMITKCEIENMITETIRERSPSHLQTLKERLWRMTLSILQRIKSMIKILMCWRFFHFATEWWYRAVRRKKNPRDFYVGHPGKRRCKSLMRCYVYWPNMEKDIADMVDSCKGCALAAKAPAITCKPWPKTVQPWQRIHVDFAGPLDD